MSPAVALDFLTNTGLLGTFLGTKWADQDPPRGKWRHTYWPGIRDLVVQSNLDPGRALIDTLLNQVRVCELGQEGERRGREHLPNCYTGHGCVFSESFSVHKPVNYILII